MPEEAKSEEFFELRETFWWVCPRGIRHRLSGSTNGAVRHKYNRHRVAQIFKTDEANFPKAYTKHTNDRSIHAHNYSP